MSGLSTTTITHPRFELASIFRLAWGDYVKRFGITLQQLRVVKAILYCRTRHLGYHEDECDHCGHVEFSYNSCRDRHCPKCQGSARLKWLSARLQDVLPISYFHVVFTLPHSLNGLLLWNKAVLYELFFQAASETLLAFAATPKHLGAKPGFIGILHTWGQNLWYHVHLHFIISSGGWDEERQRWVEHHRHERFLYPVFALSEVFQGKFISGLKQLYRKGKLNFPDDLEYLEDEDSFEWFLSRITSQRWNTYAKAPFSGPVQFFKYIGRYTHRVAISNDRLVHIDPEWVHFRYKDYKDNHTVKTMKLRPVDFIHRFLHHIVPKGFRRIRHYGFLAGNTKSTLLPKIRDSLKALAEAGKRKVEDVIESVFAMLGPNNIACPQCKIGRMITIHIEEVTLPLTHGFP